jgi:hypothetical protein
MRHFIAGAVLIAVALAVTMGVATMLQDRAARTQPTVEYVPPALQAPGAPRTKPGEPGRSVYMMSRRLNDDGDNTRGDGE